MSQGTESRVCDADEWHEKTRVPGGPGPIGKNVAENRWVGARQYQEPSFKRQR